MVPSEGDHFYAVGTSLLHGPAGRILVVAAVSLEDGRLALAELSRLVLLLTTIMLALDVAMGLGGPP